MALSQASHALEQRHKLSLSRLADKNQCIQDWIYQLESTILPTLEDLDDFYDVGILEEAWKEHREIDVETQRLDSGELRSLRLLAKAASQKELNGEDTDLIEITLTTLFSLDKLLHLLRQRSKTLHLLQARITWNGQVQQVENDYNALLQDGLPRFLSKARWTMPKDTSSQPRLSNGSRNPSSPSHSTLRGTTTNSSMARQMRSEILSLDLASLTSRIHTLLYSTLSSTGKTLDIMIDSSSTPIPERYLDSQDALEEKVKKGLKGIPEFCSKLGKQWKEADEIWWISIEENNALEALEREVNEATLKLPSSEKADGFEGRLENASKTLQELMNESLEKLSIPTHPLHFPEQENHNQLVRQELEIAVKKSLATLARTTAVVARYRSAVTALSTAQVYQASVSKLIQDIKAGLTSISPTSTDPSFLESSPVTPRTPSDLDGLSSVVKHADTDVLPRATDILLALQKAGIDPNIRRGVHEAVMALAGVSKEARQFVDSEKQRREILDKASQAYSLLRKQQEVLDMATANLLRDIEKSKWQESGTVATLVDSALPTSASSSSTAQIDLLLADLENTASAVGQSLLQKLREERKALQEAVDRHVNLLNLLKLVRKQARVVEEVRKEQDDLVGQLQSHLTSLREAAFTKDNLESLSSKQTRLSEESDTFTCSLATRTPFISSSSSPAELNLAATDEAVRTYVNQLATELGRLIEESRVGIQELASAVQYKARLGTLEAQLDSLQQRLGQSSKQRPTDRHSSLGDLRNELASFMASLLASYIPGMQDLLSDTFLAELHTIRVELGTNSTTLQTAIREAIEATAAEISQAQAEEAETERQEAVAEAERMRKRKLEAEVEILEKEVEALQAELKAHEERCRVEIESMDKQSFQGEEREEALLEQLEDSYQQSEAKSAAFVQRAGDFREQHRHLQITAEDDDLKVTIADLDFVLSTAIKETTMHTNTLKEGLDKCRDAHQKAVTRHREQEEAKERQRTIQEATLKLDEAEERLHSQDQELQNQQSRLNGCTTVIELDAITMPSLDLEGIDGQVNTSKQLVDTLREIAQAGKADLGELEDRLERISQARAGTSKQYAELLSARSAKMASLQAQEKARNRRLREEAEAERQHAETKAAREAKERAEKEELHVKIRQAGLDVEAIETGLSDLQERLQHDEPSTLQGLLDSAVDMDPRLLGIKKGLEELTNQVVAGGSLLRSDQQNPRGDTPALSAVLARLAAAQQTKDDLLTNTRRKMEDLRAAAEQASADVETRNATRHCRQTTEDVFGPEVYTTDSLIGCATATSLDAVSSPSPPSDTPLLVPALSQGTSLALLDIEETVKELNFDRFLQRLPKNSSQQMLPTKEDAQAAQRQVSLAHAHLDDIAASLDNATDRAKLNEIGEVIQQRTREASRILQLAAFAEAAERTDVAISELLDAIDEKENDISAEAVTHASQMISQMKNAGQPVADDSRVSKRMEQLEEIWLELRSLAEREQFASPTMSRSASRASSVASDLSVSSRRSVSAYHPRSQSRMSNVSTPRLPSSESLSRIPVASSPRPRTKSSTSAFVPSASKLPIPSSPAVGTGFLAPRSSSRKSSRDIRKSPAPPTPLLRKSLSNNGLASPPGSRRSSNRRSSGAYKPNSDERPNQYRPNAKRKLDVAVGRIVNTMNVPVTITPAEAFQDLSGKYWIGDPPKLYYARILRSKTVMLRVGGGWQELSSFLTTHYNSVFSAHTQLTSPTYPQSRQDSPNSDGNRSWLSAASLKASLPDYRPNSSASHHIQRDNPTPRAVSHDHRYGLSRTISNSSKNGIHSNTMDLTSLLVKSTSRTPPTIGTNQQQRSKSASIPWRI